MGNLDELDGEYSLTGLTDELTENFGRFKRGEITEEEYDQIAAEISAREKESSFKRLSEVKAAAEALIQGGTT